MAKNRPEKSYLFADTPRIHGRYFDASLPMVAASSLL